MSNQEQPKTAQVKNYGNYEAATPKTSVDTPTRELLFSRQNFLLIGLGLLTVVLGFVLMSGGQMPNPDTFDESIIYSTRRITIAPITVLAGLGIIVYAIFAGKKSENA